MELDRMAKFTAKSLILFVIVNFAMSTLSPVLVGVVNNLIGKNEVQRFLGSQSFQSFFAWLCMTLIMMWVLSEDSRKNTAYKCWDGINTAITFMLIFAAYLVPVFYIEEAVENTEVVLLRYFYSCEWLRKGGSYEAAAMLSAGISIAFMLAAYVTVHLIYEKKHPEVKEK